MEIADSKLRCALVYRLDESAGSPAAVYLAKYDHAKQYEAQGGEQSSLYGEKDNDYSKVVAMVITKDPPGGLAEAGGIGGFKVVKSDRHQVVFGADSDGICYAVVTGLNYSPRVAMQGLAELASDFTNQHGSSAKTAPEGSLNKSGKKVLASFCAKYDAPENVDKTAEIKSKVEEVTSTMQDNVAQMLNNMEKTDDLSSKSDILNEQAAVFKQKSNRLKKEMQWKNMKMTLILGGIIFLILIIILVPLIAKAKKLSGN